MELREKAEKPSELYAFYPKLFRFDAEQLKVKLEGKRQGGCGGASERFVLRTTAQRENPFTVFI